MLYHFIRNTVYVLASLLSLGETFAQTTDQNFPVTAQAFIVPQANQKLANYFSSSQALTVNLLLKDLTKSSIQVYLKWSMDGPGIRVSSTDGYVPSSFITLQRGVIERLSGLSLQNDYFRNGLIEEQGLGGNPLRTNLPEGFYTFRVQALEAGSGREVSNIGETYFSITTPLPPVINIPFNGAELTMSESQRVGIPPVNIQWMPRHYKLAGNITTYDLKVCKVPDGFEPTEALDACVNPVIDDKANPGTFYPGNTGIANSIIGAFERGARYAARVTIHEFDMDGQEVVFANEGRSEVTWFRYGAPCLSPEAFTIREIGPGRVQLNWDTQTDNKSYKILYRKAGDSNWTTQTVSGNTLSILNLSRDKYEFAVQAACTEIMPLNLQAFELEQEDDDELPPILQNPLLTLVSVNGKGESVVIDSLGKILNKTKIPCASRISSYESCEADLPVVNPIGTKPLTTLSAGDMLNIYDMAVIVTSVDGGSAFSGKGLAWLPFAENTTVSVEFRGVQAWKDEEVAGTPAAQGGCVYQIGVGGYFRTSKLTDSQLAAEQSQLIAALNGKTDSTGFNGTLADALKAYDASVTAGDVSKYTVAVLQGSGAITAVLDEIVDEYSDPRLIVIKTALDSLMKVLTMNDSLIRAGDKVTKIVSLSQTYEDLFKKLEELEHESQPDPNNPLYVLSNVQVSHIDDQSARISWVPSGNLAEKYPTRYVVEYQDPNGGVLQETVTGTQINLQRLQPGLQYKYRILAYYGDQVVTSYGQDVFKTIKKTVPVPENLTFVRIDDYSATVTWDKNAEHKTYKLVYTDERGEVHYLYPTTNSATLTGLDPGKFYDYEIVAYNQQRLVSDPANARVATGEECKLSLTVLNAQNSVSVTGTKHMISVSGCVPSGYPSGTAYPPVGWSNGTAGTINGTTITFADGETVNTFGGRIIMVDPVKSTVYTAICRLGSGASAKTCTYSTEVKVSSSACDGQFKILASAETIEKGGSVKLISQGCNGEFSWQKGLGTANEILLSPVVDMIVSAQCVENGKTCYSNPITINILSKCPTIFVKETITYPNKLFGIRWSTDRFIHAGISGCDGNITWRHDGKAKVVDQGNTFYNLKDVKGNVTIYALCNVGTCPESKLLVSEPSKNCNDNVLSYKVDYESNSVTITDKSGDSFLLSDGVKQYNSTYERTGVVPLNNPNYVYTATYQNGCKSSVEVIDPFNIIVEVKKDSPYYRKIQANSYDINQLKNWDENLIKFYTNPCHGKLVWTNDQDNSFKSENSQLFFSLNGKVKSYYEEPFNTLAYPERATTYYATCFNVNGNVQPASNPITLLVPSEQCISITGNENVFKGDYLELIASGCFGNATWIKNGNQFGTGFKIHDVPLATAKYTLECDTPKCSASKTVTVGSCLLNPYQDKASTKPGDEIVLTAAGCGTTVIWQDASGNFAGAGKQLKISPYKTVTLRALCSLTDCKEDIEVKVPVMLPPKIECEELIPDAQPKVVNKGELNNIVLTATGCTGGKTIWNGPGLSTDTPGIGDNQTVTARGVKDVAKYKVKCEKEVVGITEAEIDVKAALRLTLSANPSTVEKGKTTTLTAEGCGGGAITWVDANKTCQSPCVLSNVTINEPKTFTATCVSGTESVERIIKVSVKEIIKSPSNTDFNSIYNSGCSAFGASVTALSNPNNEYPYASGTTFKLETYSCAQGGKVTWEILGGNPISGNTHKPSETTTYVAKCIVNGSVCAEAHRTVEIYKFTCEDFFVKYEQKFPGDHDFYPSWCASTNSSFDSGKSIKLYKANGLDQEIPIGSTTNYDPGSIPSEAIEFKCVPDTRYPQRVCYYTFVFDEKKQYSFYGRTQYIAEGSNAGGRLLKTEGASKNSVVVPCQKEYPLQDLMASYFKTLICEIVDQYSGDDKILSETEAKVLLVKLQDAVTANTDLKKYNIDLSSISSSALAAAMQSANGCQAAGTLLGSAIKGSASTDIYNDAVRNTLPDISEQLSQPQACPAADATVAKIGASALETGIDGNTVAAQFSVASPAIKYRFSDGFVVSNGKNVFEVKSVPDGVDGKWIGSYVAYFKSGNPDAFLGFYKVGYSGNCMKGYTVKENDVCKDLCSEGFLPKEFMEVVIPLNLIATATDATCVAEDGVINLKATGGVVPYQFSIDGTIFQESTSFTKLEAGAYTLTLKDSKNATATATATVKEPEVFIAVPSLFLPTLRLGTVDPNAKIATNEGFIDVSYDETTRKTTFKLKAGFDLKATSSGVWKLTVTNSDPEDKKLEGVYQAYYNDCDHNAFIGFYRIDPAITPCSPDKWKEKGSVKMLCKEGWLPEAAYAEIVKNIMIFANGYRFYGGGAAAMLWNSPKEYSRQSEIITNDAVNNYWGKTDVTDSKQVDMDLNFVERRKPDVVYYLDGHHSITTSNHNVAGDVKRSMTEKFLPGMLGSLLAQQNMLAAPFAQQLVYLTAVITRQVGYVLSPFESSALSTALSDFWKKHVLDNCSGNPGCVTLDTTPNNDGFQSRYLDGEQAYSALLPKLLKINKIGTSKIVYHIDVVAHSMGFAEAQGLIETLKWSHRNGHIKIKWGGYYIIAPENGSAGTVNPADWEQIWQYGSDFGEANADPMWDQDGVAPQAAVQHISDNPSKGGRAFIPKNQNIPKGYVESHSISYYGWIFGQKPEEPGYVTPR